MMRSFPVAGLVLALVFASAGCADAAQSGQANAPPVRMTGPEDKAFYSDPAGYWTGNWTKFGDVLPVAVTVQKTPNGTYTASFDSDALQVAGIPFETVTYAPPNVRFVLRGDKTTAVFEGEVLGNEIVGKFTEGPAAGTFYLERGTAPEANLRVRDVTFRNGDVSLSGTLILPVPSPARYRAVVFLHGSGAEGRWANRYLAQKFALKGVAALIFDKRGVGGSTGDWRTATFDDLAGDGAAAVHFLQTLPEIHPENIGIFGHSQGGTLAPLVAERVPEVEFVIASAASGLRPDRVEEYSVGNSIDIAHLPEAEKADAWSYVRELVGVAYRGKSRNTLDTLAAQFKGRSWFFAPPPPNDYYWTLSRALSGYRPLLHWKNVHARVLLVYGQYDLRVPPEASLNAIRDAVKEGNSSDHVLRYWMVPGADHTYTLVNQPVYGTWPKRVPEYADRLISWVLWDHGREGQPEW